MNDIKVKNLNEITSEADIFEYERLLKIKKYVRRLSKNELKFLKIEIEVLLSEENPESEF